VKRVGAVDIGTNSVRLLVAELDGATPRDAKLLPLDRRMRITRLGQGVDRTRALAPEAIDRTTAVLREYRAALDEYGVTAVRATATSAARDSSNRDEFFTAAHDALGVTPELLSGEEEATLSFLGATADLDAPAPYLVVDIGGGSTEFVLGTDAPTGLVSLDMGCVRISEQYLHSDPYAPEELSNAVAAVRDLVAEVPRLVPGAADAATLVGLAGTVTTVAAIALGLKSYDPAAIHGSVISMDQVTAVTHRLLLMTHAQRAALPVMHPGRVDVIGGGALVLRTLMDYVGASEVIASEHDILDGIALSLR